MAVPFAAEREEPLPTISGRPPSIYSISGESVENSYPSSLMAGGRDAHYGLGLSSRRLVFAEVSHCSKLPLQGISRDTPISATQLSRPGGGGRRYAYFCAIPAAGRAEAP